MPKNKIPEPTAAINYVKRKLPVSTGRWDTLKHGEHVHAFTVAHSTTANVIDDIFDIMTKSMQEGTGLGDFKRDMRALMAERGWYGSPDKTAKDTRYINWRLDTIYQTNILTAYSAGETREMLKTAHLYPYWQYQQMQRPSRRESHSPFHGMILRYDDPFWSTGTPPNGWGCQCYRNQLTQSQAKALGGPSIPPPTNIQNSAIPKEWRYDPGREMFAPRFTLYDKLKTIKHNGKPAIAAIKDTYREEMKGYQFTQAEWDIYVANLTGDKLPKNRAYADMPILFSTLRQDAADAIGEDVKLMVTDKQIIHAQRSRINRDGSIADINLSLKDIKRLPQIVANPEAIYKDMISKNWVFQYPINKTEDARIVFIPGQGITSMKLQTFYRDAKGKLKSDDNYKEKYPKDEE